MNHKELLKKWRQELAEHDYRHKYPLTKDSLVLDLGAYKGKWCIAMAKRYGCRVIAYEPIFHQELREAVGDLPIEIVNKAVAGSSGTVECAINKDASSIVHSKEQKTVKIQTIAVVDVFNEFESIDLMKLNVEVAEYEIFESMTDEMLARVASYQIQFHRNVPDFEERRRRIRKRIAETHSVTYCYDFIWEGWDRRR